MKRTRFDSTHYEIGYRRVDETVVNGRFSTPYFDFAVAFTHDAAIAIERKMQRDFPQAEFRVLEVRND